MSLAIREATFGVEGLGAIPVELRLLDVIDGAAAGPGAPGSGGFGGVLLVGLLNIFAGP